VIVITGGLRDEMVRRGVSEEKIMVVPNGVDLKQFGPREYDSALAQELGISNEVVIGFAGSLTFYEGLDDLLHAGWMLRQRTSIPFRFLFVGDGPVLEELQHLAIELDMMGISSFPGRVPHDEVNRYLSLMSITPFPRKPLPVCEMVSPLKPLESMATGAVVLASDVQALREMVPDGGGLTFEKGSVGDLADKLQILIEDSSLRETLAANARIWVQENRTWERVSQGIDDLYEELAPTLDAQPRV
jgi:glycosyltransferase involved in cell wall biosynthesis